MATRVRRASTNVSRDLGFSAVEAENLRIRAGLMTKLVELIRRRGLTQAAAARLLRVSQPRVSDLVRGRIERFSIDMLVTMLARAGLRVKIVLSPRSKVA